MFKEKSSKKRISSNQSAKETATLDARHQQRLQEIARNYESLEALKEERNDLIASIDKCQKHIKELKDAGDIDTVEYDEQWRSNIHMQDRKAQLSKIIYDLETAKDEIDYYESTGRILFKYYDVLENQDSVNGMQAAVIKPGVPAQPSKSSRKRQPIVVTRSILDAFAGLGQCQSQVVPTLQQHSTPSVNTTITTTPPDKSALVDEYISQIDPHYLRPKNEDGLGNCPICVPSIPLVCIQHEGIMVCPTCGYQDILLVEQNRPLLRQVTKESTASYKRINHFREWCSQLQGKESTDIPEVIFEQILQELKKEKIVDKKKITYSKMREILKRLRVNKYYEHINYIINRINGMPTPHFTPELEDKLCSMFKEIQGPFLNAVMKAAKERKNFLSYAYCLHQFFKILNLPEYLKFTTLLKSREKLYVQDQIFKHICEELGWPFYPTL